jgi:hypothetical protein
MGGEGGEDETGADAFASPASGMSTDDDDTDDDTHTVIERRGSISAETCNGGRDTNRNPPRAPSPVHPGSSSDVPKVNSHTNTISRRAFTRSRSPAPHSLGLNGLMPQSTPPSPTACFLRTRSAVPAGSVLPGTLSIRLSFWMTPWEFRLRIDAKHVAESAILISALAWAGQKLQSLSSVLSFADDGLSIGTLAPLWSASPADHIHVRALCRHFCFIYLLDLESLFLYTNHPFFHQHQRLGIARRTLESSLTGVTRTSSWHHPYQQLTRPRKPGICMDDRTQKLQVKLAATSMALIDIFV